MAFIEEQILALRDDPEELRRVLAETFLGGEPLGPSGGVLDDLVAIVATGQFDNPNQLMSALMRASTPLPEEERAWERTALSFRGEPLKLRSLLDKRFVQEQGQRLNALGSDGRSELLDQLVTLVLGFEPGDQGDLLVACKRCLHDVLRTRLVAISSVEPNRVAAENRHVRVGEQTKELK